MIDFSGKRVLVTGGTRGIGRAIVAGFLGGGARVAVNGSSEESVRAALAALPAGSEACAAAPGSVADVAGCERVVEAALEALGGLDVLVNNAGVSSGGVTLEQADLAHWEKVVNTNLRGTFFCTKFALPALRESRGNVVNVGSTWGLVGARNASAYCASKGGVVNLTRALALELGPDIRVNCVCPGSVDTDMLRASTARVGPLEAGLAALAEAAPIGRIGAPRDLASAVLYLACEELARFVTGTVLTVDGGELAL